MKVMLSVLAGLQLGGVLLAQAIQSDPRNYITVVEVNQQSRKQRTLFHGPDQAKGQRCRVVDVNSVIEIKFDQEALANNLEFVGNLSLMAKIGDRSVEVNPYSMVGENQGRIGMQAKPSKEIARCFIGFLGQSEALYGNIVDVVYSKYKINNLILPNLEYLINHYSLAPEGICDLDSAKNGDIKEKLTVIVNFVPNSYWLDFYIKNSRLFKNRDVRDELVKVRGNITGKGRNESVELFDRCRKAKESLELSLKYLTYFKFSGEETENAFLSLVGLDRIFLDNLYQRMKRASAALAPLDTMEISRYKPGPEVEMLGDFIDPLYKLTNLKDISLFRNFKLDSFSSIGQAQEDSLVGYLARQAGQTIFQKLIYGTIDLAGTGAKEDEEVKIYVLWYRSDDNAKPDKDLVQLSLGSYRLRELGYRMKISDSFLLIKELVADKSDPELSPSNFKGAPGISMLWTYSSGEAGWNLMRLEPSLGLNISYIDFYRNKDVEIGTGLIAGLFRNKIFVNYGYNLNAERKNAIYWGLGFSFANFAGHK